MALGGRPKEEGGHTPLKITVNEFVARALEKVDNKSQFLESVARPVLEKLDPGEASSFLWNVDAYLKQGIAKATQEGNFTLVQTLSWLAGQLEEARQLCGPPPSDFRFSDVKLDSFYTELDDFRRRNERLTDNSLNLYNSLRTLIGTLPKELSEKLIPSMTHYDIEIQNALTLVDRLSWAKKAVDVLITETAVAIKDYTRLAGVPLLNHKQTGQIGRPQLLQQQVTRAIDLFANPPVHRREDGSSYHSLSEFWNLAEILRNEPQLKPLFDDAFERSALKRRGQVSWTGQLTKEETHELLGRLMGIARVQKQSTH